MDMDVPPDNASLRYHYTWALGVERDFDPEPPTRWMMQNWWQSIVLSVVYYVLIQLGQRFMKHRPAFELKAELILWNAFLAAFSIAGTARFAPDFFWALTQKGFEVRLGQIQSTHIGLTRRTFVTLTLMSMAYG